MRKEVANARAGRIRSTKTKKQVYAVNGMFRGVCAYSTGREGTET